MKHLSLLITLVLAGLLPGLACAEKADRDKPINLEANRIIVDDAKKQHILEGKVQLVQGTLVIRCEKLVITQDANGFQRGVASGGDRGLARFRQKREGKDDYVDGEAERIVYDASSDKTEFFVRAYLSSGNDEVRGEYVLYDGRTETYVVSSAATAAGGEQRVRAVIQPKSRHAAEAASTAETPAFKPDKQISNTHQNFQDD